MLKTLYKPLPFGNSMDFYFHRRINNKAIKNTVEPSPYSHNTRQTDSWYLPEIRSSMYLHYLCPRTTWDIRNDGDTHFSNTWKKIERTSRNLLLGRVDCVHTLVPVYRATEFLRIFPVLRGEPSVSVVVAGIFSHINILLVKHS